MNGVLFLWVKINRSDKRSPKSSIWTEISLVRNNELLHGAIVWKN